MLDKICSVIFLLVEFYKYTNENAAIWLAELLVYYQPLEYSWPQVVLEMGCFYSFSEVLKKNQLI